MSLIKNLVRRIKIKIQNDKGYLVDKTKIKRPNLFHPKKKMKIDQSALSKAIKDGRKAGTHKCIFSYTESKEVSKERTSPIWRWLPHPNRERMPRVILQMGTFFFKNASSYQRSPRLQSSRLGHLQPHPHTNCCWRSKRSSKSDYATTTSTKDDLHVRHLQSVHRRICKDRTVNRDGTDIKLKELLHSSNIHDLRINVYNKIKYYLANLTYGTDIPRSNSYIQLQSTMQKFRTDLIQGIMNYHRRVIQFQTYLPETTWEGGSIDSYPKVELTSKSWTTRELSRSYLCWPNG